MKIGRNELCHCGSGKKYKRCCLEKDRATALPPPRVSEASEEAEEPVEDGWEEAEASDPVEPQEATRIPEKPEPPLPRDYPRPDDKLPELPPEQNKIIEAWWKATAPVYRKRDADQMIKRLETALAEFPGLVVHLDLHQEFLFELGAELGRRGRMPEYVSLLKRLRREQPQMYSFSYGAYDSDVVAELVVTGHVEEIPAYLDFFRQYPDAQPDYCHQICNLLAWRGYSEPLYLLCEAVAGPMVTSSQVIGGNFALDWLIRREEIPFYEGGDDSPSAVERTADALRRLGEGIQFPLEPDANWLRAGLKACSESPQIEPRRPLNDHAQRRLTLNFAAALRRSGKAPWVQGFLLADLLQDFFSWSRRQKLPWARLQKKDIEAFALYRSKSYFWVNGVLVLAILQAMVWFADYLGAAGVVSTSEVERITEDCRQLFSAGRKVVESTDPAYRICPTFEELAGLSASWSISKNRT